MRPKLDVFVPPPRLPSLGPGGTQLVQVVPDMLSSGVSATPMLMSPSVQQPADIDWQMVFSVDDEWLGGSGPIATELSLSKPASRPLSRRNSGMALFGMATPTGNSTPTKSYFPIPAIPMTSTMSQGLSALSRLASTNEDEVALLRRVPVENEDLTSEDNEAAADIEVLQAFAAKPTSAAAIVPIQRNPQPTSVKVEPITNNATPQPVASSNSALMTTRLAKRRASGSTGRIAASTGGAAMDKTDSHVPAGATITDKATSAQAPPPAAITSTTTSTATTTATTTATSASHTRSSRSTRQQSSHDSDGQTTDTDMDEDEMDVDEDDDGEGGNDEDDGDAISDDDAGNGDEDLDDDDYPGDGRTTRRSSGNRSRSAGSSSRRRSRLSKSPQKTPGAQTRKAPRRPASAASPSSSSSPTPKRAGRPLSQEEMEAREERLKVRQEKNRLAAKKCRERKQQFYQELETKNNELEDANAALQKEVAMLRQRLAAYETGKRL